jgi:hypothetical protein
MTPDRTRPSVNRGHLTSVFSGQLTSALTSRTAFSRIAVTRLPGRGTWTSSTTSTGCGRTTGRTGRTPQFGWYVRTDPQIAEVYGRPDHALVAFPECAARLQAAGDYWGVHPHPIRWAPECGQWVHEFGDGESLAQSTRFALDAFGRWAGAPPRLFRAGAGFLNNRIVEVIEQAGVAIDLTLEPVPSWGVGAPTVSTGVDASRIVGAYTDCGGGSRTAPRAAISASMAAGRAGGSSWCRSPRDPWPGPDRGGGEPLGACCAARLRAGWRCSIPSVTGLTPTSTGTPSRSSSARCAGRISRSASVRTRPIPRRP